MKKSPNKKVFVSSASDRGILVKITNDKQKISLSFWGNDAPKNISFTQEEALDFCDHIINVINQKDDEEDNIFSTAFKNMTEQLPERHFKK